MNSIIKDTYSLFELYQALRDQMMAILDDGDLGFRPSASNQALGELCREIGEVEYSYIESFTTFSQDFSYRNTEPGLQDSVEKLTAWYKQLDQELKATIEGLSEEDIANRLIDRGPNFKISPRIQLEIYKEALLIFYGKASVYLKALGKSLPEQWEAWIG